MLMKQFLLTVIHCTAPFRMGFYLKINVVFSHIWNNAMKRYVSCTGVAQRYVSCTGVAQRYVSCTGVAQRYVRCTGVAQEVGAPLFGRDMASFSDIFFPMSLQPLFGCLGLLISRLHDHTL
jgi:hypothetical protein